MRCFSAYQTGIQAGFLTSNEASRWEGLNARPGGDAFIVPAGASLQQPEQQQQATEGARPNGSALPANARPNGAAS